MEYRKTKLLIGFGFLFALFLWLTAPVYAFEGFEVDPVVLDWTPSTPYNYKSFPETNAFGAFTTTNSVLGFELGAPVPYYSDGEHYSLFCNFTFECENICLTQGYYKFYVFPYNMTPTMSLTDSGMEIFSVNNPTSFNTCMQGTKTFTWYYDRACSCKYLVYMSPTDTAHTAVSVYMVMDLNLLPDRELRPLRMGFMQRDGLGSTPTQKLYNTWHFHFTDTSLYGLLQEIESAVSQIDFSGLSGLADLSNSVENFYQSYITNSSVEFGLLESMIDDGETDEDVTEWQSQAEVMQSQVDELQSVEESLWGTLEDFEFPTAGTITEDEQLYFGLWFVNPIITPLMLTCLALMIAFLIL